VSIDSQQLPPPPLPRNRMPPAAFPSPLPGGLVLPPALTGRVFLLGTFTHQGGWPNADQSFAHPGGVLVVAWNLTGFSSAAGTQTGQLVLDGVVVDSQTFFFNNANEHLTLPTKFSTFAPSQLGIPGALAPVATGTHKHHIGYGGSSNGSDFGYTIVLALQP
jgi:hypothetical protein